ncbi:similar to An04g01400 [Aspergillus luchuensis]|uniref:Similar to An04g01400 n=1 Tax=Aspergillus kawachii TaxID=1069201 RepID=A0A146F7G2_ASPKA|nr:similar to An04g01400 [Aspergillus luchuensis]
MGLPAVRRLQVAPVRPHCEGSPAGRRTGKTADPGAGAEGTRPLDVALTKCEQIGRMFQAYLDSGPLASDVDSADMRWGLWWRD